jgi:FtsH-binding integral membrane protein
MTPKVRDRLILALAWGFVPIAFAIFVFASYRYALGNGRLPFGESTEWRWWVAFGSCLVLGVLGIFSTAGGSVGGKTLVSVCYVAVMGIVLFAVGLFIACSQGDCL